MATQGASITVQGGLDLVSSSHALFRTPGAATILQNFESSNTGGYRRISGYQKFLFLIQNAYHYQNRAKPHIIISHL